MLIARTLASTVEAPPRQLPLTGSDPQDGYFVGTKGLVDTL